MQDTKKQEAYTQIYSNAFKSVSSIVFSVKAYPLAIYGLHKLNQHKISLLIPLVYCWAVDKCLAYPLFYVFKYHGDINLGLQNLSVKMTSPFKYIKETSMSMLKQTATSYWNNLTNTAKNIYSNYTLSSQQKTKLQQNLSNEKSKKLQNKKKQSDEDVQNIQQLKRVAFLENLVILSVYYSLGICFLISRKKIIHSQRGWKGIFIF